MNSIRLTVTALFIALLLQATLVAQDTIPWIEDLSQARSMAEQQQRLVLLHFWSDNCAPCQNVEANVFNQPELIRLISTGFIPVKIHAQKQAKIASFYKVDRFPMDVIVLPNGAEVYRTVSPAKPNAYIAMLDQVRANALSTGLHEVNRVARNVDRMAQNAKQFGLPIHATLPPRQGEDEPTSHVMNTDPGYAGSDEDWRNSATNSKPVEEARKAVVNNEFVGPLDRKPETKPSTSGQQRYENPYLDQSPAAETEAAPTQEDSVSQPAPQTDTGYAQANANEPSRPWQTDRPVVPDAGYEPSVTPAPAQNQNTQNQNVQNQTFQNPTFQNQSFQNQVQPTPAQQLPTQPTLQTSELPRGQMNPGGAQPNVAPADPVQQRGQNLPPNVPPLALDGFCPVTLVESNKWEQGNPQFGAIHRGRTYLFRSQVERDRFMTAGNADHYAPVLSGYDPVRFVELNQTVEGNRAHGVVYQHQVYLFADEQALIQFEQQPNKYVTVVRQAMANARNAPPQR